MKIADRVSVSSLELTAEGYLRAPAKIARVGIQEYWGFEFGITPGDKLLRLYRPADEVFHPDALASFALKPVTIGHPSGGVQATTWKDHAVGTSGETIGRSGSHVTATLLITDANAINDVQRGVVELSCGYDFDLDMTPGADDEGQPYDGVMRGIRGNHIAIVPQGRCGGSCKIGDVSQGSPKVVMLMASAETKRNLNAWATAQGFDLSKTFGGREINPDDFDFHVTLLASTNPITLPTGAHDIPPITLDPPTEMIGLGRDGSTPALAFPVSIDLARLRTHLVETYRARPTYAEFRPHISVSYSWDGSPALDTVTRLDFPIVLDRLVVDDFDPPETTDMPKATDCGGAPACKCASRQPQDKDKPIMKTVTIDGATFDVADDKLAAAIDALNAKLKTRDEIMADLTTLLPGMDAKLADLNAQLAAKDAEVAAAKAAADEAAKKVPTAADLEKIATERAAVITKAKALAADLEIGDKSIPQIKRAVVEKVKGADAVKDRSDDYVTGVFEALSAGDTTDPVAKSGTDTKNLKGRDLYLARLEGKAA